jgi:hypothetical protein
MNPYLAAAEDALDTIRKADPATYAATLAQLAIASALGEVAEAMVFPVAEAWAALEEWQAGHA